MWSKSFKTAIAASVLVSMAALTACGGGAGGPAQSEGGNTGNNAALAPLSTEQVNLTLSVMTSNRFLELVKQKFEEAHPNIKVEIKEAVAAPQPEGGAAGPGGGKTVIIKGEQKSDPRDAEKFVSTLNTELMSGKASDIIVTNGGFPYKKYADKKLLADLNDYMNKDESFRRDDYYTNVLDAMKYKDGIYALPAKLSLNMLLGSTAALSGKSYDDTKWSWNEFYELAKSLSHDADNNGTPDAYAFAGIDGPTLLSAMVNTSFGKLVDAESKTFNTQAFKDLLNLSKSMIDSKLVTSEKLDRANLLFHPFQPDSYEDYFLEPQAKAGGGSNATRLWVPTQDDRKGLSFTSDTLMSVNAKSPHAREAWEFVKFALSEDIQKSRELFGLALNKKASAARLEESKQIGTANSKNRIMLRDKDGKEIALQPPSQQEIDELAALLDSISFYAETDPKIVSIIEKEAAPFFAGQKSAEETAKTVENKVKTYLQE
jgi:multiple sugar transport system substrate-binding protein